MSGLLTMLVGTMIGPVSGIITTRVMDYVDDVKGWTARLPDWGKQVIVAALAAVVPLANAQFGIDLSSDPTNILTQPSVQSIVAAGLAFILKGHKLASKT